MTGSEFKFFGGNFDDVIGNGVSLNRFKKFVAIKMKFYYINLP